MAKSDRFFEIIQMLRTATKPLLAEQMADALEVSTRTIYRDIAALQSMQTPIYGEAGVGYVMRKGYDLPPVNFDVDEAEAIAIGLNMIARTGDMGLWRAAGRASRKLSDAAPGTRRLIASSWGSEDITNVDAAAIRNAIREERKLNIKYCNAEGKTSQRVIWPLVLIYYVDNAMIVAWCESRKEVRHFRLDRMEKCKETPETFEGLSADLVKDWEITQKYDTVETKEF